MLVKTGVSTAGGIQSAGGTVYESYQNRRKLLEEQGLTGEALEEAARRGAIGDTVRAGVITAGIIGVTGLRGSEAVGRLAVVGRSAAARKTFGQKLTRVLTEDVLGEAGEEALDSALNSAWDGLSNNPDWTFEEFVEEVAMSGKMGGLLGGVAGGPVTLFERQATEAADAVANSPAVQAAQGAIDSAAEGALLSLLPLLRKPWQEKRLIGSQTQSES